MEGKRFLFVGYLLVLVQLLLMGKLFVDQKNTFYAEIIPEEETAKERMVFGSALYCAAVVYVLWFLERKSGSCVGLLKKNVIAFLLALFTILLVVNEVLMFAVPAFFFDVKWNELPFFSASFFVNAVASGLVVALLLKIKKEQSNGEQLDAADIEQKPFASRGYVYDLKE
ncbi:hypothetical protein M3Y99_00672000 [Aphelenchoides fujianensis]|nr:hypothetical protein M3Y99_00672000 [Aphelenchoides fujianensis]